MNEPSVRDVVLDAVLKVVGADAPEAATIRTMGLALPISDLHIDSLNLVAISMEIEERIAVDLEPRELRELGTLADLVDLVESKTPGAQQSIPRADPSQPLPLSYEQEAIWRYCRELQNPSKYGLSLIDEITGPLLPSVYLDCIRQVVRRHEILRTTFPIIGGRPVQQVNPPETIHVGFVEAGSEADLSSDDLLELHRLQTWDLEAGPLSRFVLIRVAPERHFLVRSMHHMCSDRHSVRLVIEELAALYQAADEAPRGGGRKVQYYDYSAWQRRSYDPAMPAYQGLIEWWTRQLGDVQTPELPFRRQVPCRDADPGDGHRRRPLDGDLVGRLDRLARNLRCSRYAAWLTALSVVLRLSAATEDVVMGIYVTNRRHHELRDVVGDFSSTVALRCSIPVDLTFAETLTRVAGAVREIEEHSQIPYQRVSEELVDAGTLVPPIRLIASVRSPNDDLAFANLALRTQSQRSFAMPWGCSISLTEENEGLSCDAYFDANLYDPDMVGGFIGRIVAVLDRATASPEVRVGELAVPRTTPVTR